MYVLHMMEACSSCRCTIVLYATLQIPLCFVLMLHLRNLSNLFAFDGILFKYMLKLRLVDWLTPRYLAEETLYCQPITFLAYLFC